MTAARRGRVTFDGELAGWIEEVGRGMRFVYEPTWLARADARPISLTLPLREEPYEMESIHPFFYGLLPEGWLLDVSVRHLKLDERDWFGLLLHLCGDCVGAVGIEPEEAAR